MPNQIQPGHSVTHSATADMCYCCRFTDAGALSSSVLKEYVKTMGEKKFPRGDTLISNMDYLWKAILKVILWPKLCFKSVDRPPRAVCKRWPKHLTHVFFLLERRIDGTPPPNKI